MPNTGAADSLVFHTAGDAESPTPQRVFARLHEMACRARCERFPGGECWLQGHRNTTIPINSVLSRHAYPLLCTLDGKQNDPASMGLGRPLSHPLLRIGVEHGVSLPPRGRRRPPRGTSLRCTTLCYRGRARSNNAHVPREQDSVGRTLRASIDLHSPH